MHLLVGEPINTSNGLSILKKLQTTFLASMWIELIIAHVMPLISVYGHLVGPANVAVNEVNHLPRGHLTGPTSCIGVELIN